ncbi:hemin storage system protein [Serratia entomophila]|uniref:poly-beta-1,6-N-acetyl-D-glucosamine biosynthesis protein PgaD n=1 Tax=Serratia entomophila TaxID=42906 RepID=UPI00217CA495|nr:poly-beta-1,6-N-acetyl-D-glucosamine biosynthesis protein PgaD [Serratia entomophila]CAI0697870.1 hemin storage system protein [Serratia entomophila]CAI1742963.1 hemin storage system protein [Serratia entomophila]
MTEILIYSARGWLPRMIDGLLTLFAWCGFLYLFSRGLVSVMEQHGPNSALSLLQVISLYIVVALFNAFTLIAWAKYNQYFSRRRAASRWRAQIPNTRISYITPELTGQLKRLSNAVVFHNSGGGISQVSARLAAMADDKVVQLR